MTAPEQAAWPEGVIARYLTKAAEIIGDPELTVDITVTTEPDEPYQAIYANGIKGCPKERIKLTLFAECRGCKDNEEAEYEGLFATVMDRVLESPYGRDAQEWAQAHAEKCRAMPKPGGEVR